MPGLEDIITAPRGPTRLLWKSAGPSSMLQLRLCRKGSSEAFEQFLDDDVLDEDSEKNWMRLLQDIDVHSTWGSRQVLRRGRPAPYPVWKWSGAKAYFIARYRQPIAVLLSLAERGLLLKVTEKALITEGSIATSKAQTTGSDHFKELDGPDLT